MHAKRWIGILVCGLMALVVAAAMGADEGEKASSAAKLGSDARAALNQLYAKVPKAKEFGGKAVGILVFPSITKAGLGIGGQYGEGALLKGGKAVAYYNTAGVSSGLQIGAQKYGYAMFFMNEGALAQLDKTSGFEVGVGPTVVVMDEGKAKSTTTTSMKDDIYAFIFSQKGMMAGLGIQGNKISKIDAK
jgi:lipid-binding SYLF domain-containing protein